MAYANQRIVMPGPDNNVIRSWMRCKKDFDGRDTTFGGTQMAMQVGEDFVCITNCPALDGGWVEVETATEPKRTGWCPFHFLERIATPGHALPSGQSTGEKLREDDNIQNIWHVKRNMCPVSPCFR